MKPLCIDLYCGLGGWSEGFLAEGWDCIGFDTERHDYGTGGYPGQLVLQDVLTLHGSQFKNAHCIVCSPPCQEYSYMAMPWTRGKAIAAEYRSGKRDVAKLTALFDACFRIQREASEAAGRHIPLIVENVKGAQPWVGRAAWHFGSFYLWGDIPALMPIVIGRQIMKGPAPGTGNQLCAVRLDQIKNNGGSWFNIGSPGQKETNRNPVNNFEVSEDGVKGFTPNGQPLGKNTLGRKFGSKSKARKAASAAIAKIPFVLAQHIARAYKPQ
jgi:hypothetical protein